MSKNSCSFNHAWLTLNGKIVDTFSLVHSRKIVSLLKISMNKDHENGCFILSYKYECTRN